MTWYSHWCVCLSISLILPSCLSQSVPGDETIASLTPFQLTYTPAHVVNQVTHDVTLLCSHGGKRTSRLQEISRIRMVKKSATIGWQLLAEMRDNEPEPYANLNVSVSARISRNVQETFLQVTWPVANQDTFGTYKCDVVGIERFSLDSVTEKTSEVAIMKDNVTSGDMLDIFKETKHDLSTLADATNSLVKNMNFLNEKLNLFRDKLDGKDEEFDRFREKLNSSRKAISSVSGNITTMSGSINSLINKVSVLNDTTVTTSDLSEEVTSLSNNIESANGRIDDIEEKLIHLQQKDDKPANGRIDDVEEKLIHLQQKDANLIVEIRYIYTKLASLIRENGLKSETFAWPEGQFALLQPKTGCPEDPAFSREKDKYFKIHTESSSGRNSDEDPYSVLPPGTISSNHSKNFFTLAFCESSGVRGDTRPWPSGSYCINKIITEACPGGFHDGYIRLDFEDLEESSEYTTRVVEETYLHFCCMTAGDADIPIALPTHSTFLLYRRGGQCQKVKGMNVATVTISIDTEDNSNYDSNFQGPDVVLNHTDPLKFYLCSYTKD